MSATESLAARRYDRRCARLSALPTRFDPGAVCECGRPGLRPLPLADYDAIRQGNRVPFRRPGGLRHSVTLRVVSSTARNPIPMSRPLFIQTDAPITLGQWRALVNVIGDLGSPQYLHPYIFWRQSRAGFPLPSAIIASAGPAAPRQYGLLPADDRPPPTGHPPALARPAPHTQRLCEHLLR